MNAADPWLAVGDPVAPQPDQQPTATATPVAPPIAVPGAATRSAAQTKDPWLAVADPVTAPAVSSDTSAASVSVPAATPAKIVDSSHLEGHFGDDVMPREPATKFTPEQEAAFLDYAKNGATAQQLRDWGLQHGGMQITNADDIAKAIATPGARVNSNFAYELPKPATPSTAGGALARGAADMPSMGTDTKLFAGISAANDWLGGGAQDGFIDDYHRHLDVNNGMLAADEADHPIARLTGQILGGLVVAPELAGEALTAGKSVLRAGGTMREARAAAASAAAVQQAKVGGAIGGLHGVGSADNLQDAVTGGLTGAVTGAAAGYGLTRAGQALPRALDSLAASPVWAFVDKIDPVQPDYVQIARNLQIARTPATGGGVGRLAQETLGVMPGATGVVDAAKGREIEGVGDAAKRIAQTVGTPTDREGAGKAAAAGAQNVGDAMKAEAKGHYDARESLMGGTDAPVPTPNTAANLQTISQKLPNPVVAALNEHPAIRKIASALPDDPTTSEVPTGILKADGTPCTNTVTDTPAPLTLDEATEALSYIRSVRDNLAAQPGADKKVLARVTSLAQSLNSDVKSAASAADEAAGRVPGEDGSALAAHMNGDRTYAIRSSVIGPKGSLGAAYQSAQDPLKVSSESVYNNLVKNTDKDNGNAALFREQWFRLPDEAKSTIAATRIDDMGKSLPGAQNADGDAWSFNNFMTNFNRMSPQTRNIMFGPDAAPQLRQLAEYAGRLKAINSTSNFSNTARATMKGAFGYVLTGMLVKGDIGGALETAASTGGLALLAKAVMGTPALRDVMLKGGKILTNAAMPPAVKEGAITALTNRLSTIANQDPTIAANALGLQRAIRSAANDNGRVAAVANQPGSITPSATSAQPVNRQSQ